MADKADNTLHMLLHSVQGLPAQEAMAFTHEELHNHSTQTERTSITSIANNPESVLIFSKLLAIPMFKEHKIAQFEQLYTWRKVTRAWLDHFLRFAVVSFQFLGLNPESPADVSYFQTAALDQPGVNFQFLDSSLLDIFQSNYKIHLSRSVFILGYQGNMTIREAEIETNFNWENSYKAYRDGVIQDVEVWVEEQMSTPMASVENPNLEWI